MGNIYKNLLEIPIPKEHCHVRKSDDRVQFSFASQNQRMQCMIGVATADGKMYPNDNYRTIYPEEWEKYYGDIFSLDVAPHLHTGLYNATVAITDYLGLYPCLIESFGLQTCHAILDVAMGMILNPDLSKSSAFKSAMKRQALFSEKLWCDTWLQDMFNTQLTTAKILSFQRRWMQGYAITSHVAWLYVGDNHQNNPSMTPQRSTQSFDSNGVPLAKMDSNLSFIFVLDGTSGLPVSWNVFNEGMPEPIFIKDKMYELSANYGVNVAGVILDSETIDAQYVKELKLLQIPFVIKMQPDSEILHKLAEKHHDSILWQPHNSVGLDTFGIVDQVAVFDNTKMPVGYYINANEAHQEALDIYNQLHIERVRILQQIRQNPYNVQVKWTLKKYFKLSRDHDGKVINLHCSWATVPHNIKHMGSFALISSRLVGAETLLNQYNIVKAADRFVHSFYEQQALNTSLVQSISAFSAYLVVSFVASVIHNELRLAANEQGLRTEEFIQELDNMYSLANPQEKYEPVHSLSEQATIAMDSLGVDKRLYVWLNMETNARMGGGAISEFRRLPVPNGSGESRIMRFTEVPSRATIERELRTPFLLQLNHSIESKRKVGRPQGSRSQWDLDRSAQKEIALEMANEEKLSQGLSPTKRRAGRPQGSKNRKTLEREAREANAAAAKQADDAAMALERLESQGDADYQQSSAAATEQTAQQSQQAQPAQLDSNMQAGDKPPCHIQDGDMQTGDLHGLEQEQAQAQAQTPPAPDASPDHQQTPELSPASAETLTAASAQSKSLIKNQAQAGSPTMATALDKEQVALQDEDQLNQLVQRERSKDESQQPYLTQGTQQQASYGKSSADGENDEGSETT